MTDTRTIGSGGDHADINAWVAWVQANRVTAGNLTDNQVGNVLVGGITISSTQTISGWAPGASNFTTTLGVNTGAGFKDNANAQTNALFFNTANGAYVDGTTSNVGIVASVDKFTCQYLQIRPTSGTPAYGVKALDLSGISSPTTNIVQGCILETYAADSVVKLPTGATIQNCLIRQRRGAAASMCINSDGTTGHSINVYDCTLFNDNNGSTGGVGGNAIVQGSYGNLVLKGCAFFGWTTEFDVRPGNTSGSNNSTNNSAFSYAFAGADPLTSSQFSLSLATEFQGGTSLNDFRLKSGSTKLKDNGLSISGITTDIVGTSRPQGTTEDIGAWELVVAASDTLFGQACL